MSGTPDKLRREAAYVEREIKRSKKDRWLYIAVEILCLIAGVILTWYLLK